MRKTLSILLTIVMVVCVGFAFAGCGRKTDYASVADAVEAYKTLEHPTEIWPQFEYNQYVRDFFADNKGASLADAIKCWHWKKLQPGSHRYERSDLEK